MGPLESFFCWQAILVALTASGFAQLTKMIIDVVWGMRHETPTPTMSDALKVGGLLRKESLIINRLILPVAPVLGGFLFAMIVPVRPDVLEEYTAHKEIVGWQATLIYGAWGAACGQFADYAVTKVKDALGMRGATTTPSRTTTAPAAAPAEPSDPGPPKER